MPPPAAVTDGALSSGGSFYYHAPLQVSGVAPPLGPERGGTRVAVLGAGFRDAYTLRCRFDNASSAVLARYVDASQLECVTPLHSLGAKLVLVSMNAQQYSGGGGGVRYTYQAAAAVSSVSPSVVAAEGGTPVTVRGSGFSAASEALGYLLCRIGGVVRRARWASPSALVCNTTRSAAGEALVELHTTASALAHCARRTLPPTRHSR